MVNYAVRLARLCQFAVLSAESAASTDGRTFCPFTDNWPSAVDFGPKDEEKLFWPKGDGE